MNSLFNRYGQRKVTQPNIQNDQFNGRFKNMNDFVTQFGEFKKTVTGNPEEKVQELLNNGTMSQQQYNMLYGLAKKITKM
jgi:tRNA C32,U32 (ribose-2'-O)-methylase TrmJ